MLCVNVRWVAVLLCAWTAMFGSMGHPLDNKTNMTTVTPQMEEESREEMMPTPANTTDTNATYVFKHSVRQSLSLSAGEQEFLLKRKQVALKALNKLGIKSTLDSVPHVAILGSGGGQRASVSLVGSLDQLEQEGLLDTVIYLGGVSGTALAMYSLYSDPQWSRNMDRAVSRLSAPGVKPLEVVSWLGQKAKDKRFSLSDIWGVFISAAITKQLVLRRLSDDRMNTFNPYPIYNAVNKKCLKNGPVRGKWFELTPHEAGFTDLGLFINTSHVGSSNYDEGPEGKETEMDMTQMQGIMTSALADEESMLIYCPDWMKGLVGSVNTALSKMKNMKKSLDGILEQGRQKVMEPLQTWSDSLSEGPVQEKVSWMIQKGLPMIGNWEWGTTENFLYQYPGAEVPSCISGEKHLQLIDGGLMMNMPFPPFLGEKRDADLLITLDSGASQTFETLSVARDYAKAMKKPFPEIDDRIFEEKDWPEDCYVFEGKDKEPTIVYIPLFNRHNCKDVEEVQAKMKEFSTFQLPLNQERIEFVLETAKANIRNNKDTLLMEIYKASRRRHKKM
ncbi:cytosolic phospholipase A2 gamma-like [Trematomus bernacchii]|uniref:cytosolic phospholipase A2 gamma-like n=1 Tax=Trematomus bernacchii TaxID=40690 RepID=UPI001469C36E|nr:cytosolic phospholipase A2 gamma-like [Trematomus bernacchii]XP_033969553.1 cytosolic phospholipase A2 gamma-like [Trematomus bernacchii]